MKSTMMWSWICRSASPSTSRRSAPCWGTCWKTLWRLAGRSAAPRPSSVCGADDHLVFAVDNSCETEPAWKDGRLLSSKREGGFGTGTRSVQRTAERSGGTAKFTYQDGVFYASIFLYE